MNAILYKPSIAIILGLVQNLGECSMVVRVSKEQCLTMEVRQMLQWRILKQDISQRKKVQELLRLPLKPIQASKLFTLLTDADLTSYSAD